MPVLRGRLRTEGALVEVRIGLSRLEVRRLRNASRPVPAPVAVRALIDTGAQDSCVDPAALGLLVLLQRGITLANVPALGGLAPAYELDASLTVIHPSGDPRQDLIVPDLPLVQLALGVLGYQVLVGRDVLAGCKFLYNGSRGRFRLSY